MKKRLSWLLILVVAGCGSTKPAETTPRAHPVPITTKSDEARSLFIDGRAKAERFHPEEARKDLLAAVDLDPTFATAWLQLSEVAPSREIREACLAHAEQSAGEASEAERLYIHAAMAAGAGRIELAREHLARVVELHPDDPRAHYHLALNYWASDDEEALASLMRAVRLDPGLDVAWNMLGYAAAHFDRLAEAVDAHRTYVKLLPNEPNAHDSFAETLLRAGRHEDSIEQYERALALDPSFVWSRMGIGHNLVFLKRYEEARATYERAMAEAGTPQLIAAANEFLIVLGVYAGRPEDAIGAAERGITLAAMIGDFEAAMAVRTLARVHLFAGDTKRARQYAGQALARLGEDATEAARRDVTHSVLRLLAEIDLAEGDLASAARRVVELEDLSENLWEVRLTAFTAGLVALRRGAAQEALEAFERAPLMGDPRYLYYLGDAALRVGNREEARRLFARVVDLGAPSLGHALVYSSARARFAVLSYR